MAGNTLYFQPSPVANSVPYRITWSEPPVSNAASLRLSRSQTLAKDIIVVVESFNQASQATIKATSHRQQAFKASVSTAARPRPTTSSDRNLSQAQAQQLADSQAEEITRHERLLTASLPGDNMLGTRTMVQLIGTGTAWDQLYYPESGDAPAVDAGRLPDGAEGEESLDAERRLPMNQIEAHPCTA